MADDVSVRDQVRRILLEGRGGPRLLTESAVQLDVWYAFGSDINGTVDLLLTPRETIPAARLARVLFDALSRFEAREARHIMPVEGAVAARLSFDDLIYVVLPLTGLDLPQRLRELDNLIASTPMLELREGSFLAMLRQFAKQYQARLSAELRETLLVATLLAARDDISYAAWRRSIQYGWPSLPQDLIGVAGVWRVSRNREVQPFGISIETIKADAALRVFDIDCRSVTWAVIDSGIDGSHPAFRDHDAGGFATRIDKALDFSMMRALAAFDMILDEAARATQLALIRDKLSMSEEEASHWLDRLRDDAAQGRPYDWEALSRLLEVPIDRLDLGSDDKPNGHGTHVAGVLGGDWRENEERVFRGVCPNIRLYDLRVLGESSTDTEVAILAALEYVRWLNTRNRYMVIHGVNLSIGMEHDMDNYACGRTPVCMACEATVSSGVSVIAAAGNWGAQTYLIEHGSYRGYAAISIADPGNAASVITVGATHRERPHEYGVSFFSSRGPTGDGRAKPDVVAPGEKIDGPLPNLGMGRLDGTSMAAPHVSGIAALLMARHPEMVGDPAAVKATIVRSATDLGRERHFQGAGLVDALRALQAR
ncbi:S8 family peptidase [Sphingomonas sp. HITSZ_GF]|uniref:S8 family peptidase n=1 Tax=Sphingomonas sp. HITSZ_GF TaxID=3037247 RepID=UPI00240D9F44|nr:S8 family peptidase [Sphingomonas sp. HITSZ_GF]MDG2532188.1 S8 family peptidase [Sphingomonas sp. HITSZ_GF]